MGEKLSSKPMYQARRAATRDSKRIYHAKTMRTKFIQAYLAIPGVIEALKTLRTQQEEQTKEPAPCAIADAFGPDVAPEVAGQETEKVPGTDVVSWPAQVTRSLQLNVKEGVVLKDSWPGDMCRCITDCYPDVFINAATKLFCAADNCIFSGNCSNGVYETRDVGVFKSTIGAGVRATDTIPVGATIASYTGLLTDHDYEKDPHQWEYVVSLQAKGRGNKKLFIDAEEWGTVARFINHSFDPNTEFIEMRHNKDVHVMVKTRKTITAGEEITVNYGITWFDHACKTTEWRQRQDTAGSSN